MPETSDLDLVREEYEKQIYDLRQLLEVSKSLNSTLDYHILIDSILLTIMGQMKVLKAGLFAKKGLDATYFSLHRNYKGFDIDHSVNYSIPEGNELIVLFTHSNRCFTMAEAMARIGSTKGIEGLASLKPTLLVPLRAKGAVNGLIVLGDRIDDSDFEEGEKEYVLNIATLAAIAIHNVFLFEMTTTDMMTRLKMKHYFYTVLIEKMEHSSMSGRPLSVIMIDIDFFKKFNDVYGHNCGDAVLKQVAKLLQACIRGMDLAARYGGEEFCVLLPDTDRERALIIAERIRKTIAETPSVYEGERLWVTVSLGLAQYIPGRDISGKSLIDRADRALYQSKQSGRDRICAAE
ncbi:MAG TPA: diguanylate cyclase DgcA [Rectinemataceae bacterium]|nr:diguanylate cyclase DgcA [Rectinemataceae bacterium]